MPNGAPGFLVGSHRSGTTLLRFLLDSHPHIASPPESKFIAAFEACVRYPQAAAGLSTLGIGGDRFVAELGALASAWFDRYATQRGKRRWID
jgi:hypothetical protein